MHPVFFFLSLCLFFHAMDGHAALPESMTLGVGMSETYRVPGLTRVAVGDAKTVRARYLPPYWILLTGMKPGATTVRAWVGSEVRAIYLSVVAASAARAAASYDSRVARITLDCYEMVDTEGSGLGIRWPDTVRVSGSALAHGGNSWSGINYTASADTPGGWLEALSARGFARVLASPDLTVRLGEEAVFHSGGEIPVSSTSEDYGRYHRKVEWKPYGLTVRVRPESADGLHITSDVKLEISDVTSRAVEGIPALNRRTLETKTSSLDRQTVILSGLVRESTDQQRNGIPLLSQIPLVGDSLFGRISARKDRSEVVMAITFSLEGNGPMAERLEKMRHRFDERAFP